MTESIVSARVAGGVTLVCHHRVSLSLVCVTGAAFDQSGELKSLRYLLVKEVIEQQEDIGVTPAVCVAEKEHKLMSSQSCPFVQSRLLKSSHPLTSLSKCSSERPSDGLWREKGRRPCWELPSPSQAN